MGENQLVDNLLIWFTMKLAPQKQCSGEPVNLVRKFPGAARWRVGPPGRRPSVRDSSWHSHGPPTCYFPRSPRAAKQSRRRRRSVSTPAPVEAAPAQPPPRGEELGRYWDAPSLSAPPANGSLSPLASRPSTLDAIDATDPTDSTTWEQTIFTSPQDCCSSC